MVCHSYVNKRLYRKCFWCMNCLSIYTAAHYLNILHAVRRLKLFISFHFISFHLFISFYTIATYWKLRNRNHFQSLHRVIETQVDRNLGEREIVMRAQIRRASVSTAISSFLKLPQVFLQKNVENK